MKCELCNDHDAETAINVKQDGEDRELYVCNECARKERIRRQKKSQRTRKKTSGSTPDVSISVTQVGGDSAPPLFIEALMNAVHGMVNDLEKAEKEKSSRKKAKLHDFPCSRVEAAYRIGDRLHLEGLHLIGEMAAVHRAMRALDIQLVGVEIDGVKEAGHVYSIKYNCPQARVKRVVEELIEQEKNARVRLFEELLRVFGDSLCRSLAILKNCRLLAPGELFDLLSPLRLAALEDMLDGITLAEIEEALAGINLTPGDDMMTVDARDAADAERADEANRRYEDVVLNERAEEKFL